MFKNLIKEYTSFAMPGHKNNLSLMNYSDNIYEYDITEVKGADNLQDPIGILKDIEDLIANVKNVKKSYMLVNSTTSGVLSSIYSQLLPGDEILVERASHKSVYDAIDLRGLKARYIPYTISSAHFPVPARYEQIIELIEKYPNIKAVVLTYPNYYGIATDIKKISKFLKEKNIIFIADSAHGPHMFLSEELPECATKYADIVLESSHKSLPALTQTAVMHVCTDNVDIKSLEYYKKVFTTTSPSYILMDGLHRCYDIVQREGKELMSELIKNIKWFFKEAQKIEGFSYYYGDEHKGIYKKDITRILIKLEGYTGYELQEYLYEKKIITELNIYDYTVLLTSIANRKEDFENLLSALKLAEKKDPIDRVRFILPELPDSVEIDFDYDIKQVPLTDSVGKISAQSIIPYPPGVPVLVKGEIISQQIVDFVIGNIDTTKNMLGYNGKTVEIMEKK